MGPLLSLHYGSRVSITQPTPAHSCVSSFHPASQPATQPIILSHDPEDRQGTRTRVFLSKSSTGVSLQHPDLELRSLQQRRLLVTVVELPWLSRVRLQSVSTGILTDGLPQASRTLQPQNTSTDCIRTRMAPENQVLEKPVWGHS